MKSLRIGLLLSLSALAGCVPQREAPVPMPRPLPTPVRPAPQPMPQPAPQLDWRDIPLTPGGWSYRGDESGSAATFGITPEAPAFVIRCDHGSRRVTLAEPGRGGATMTIRTSFASRSFPLSDGQATLTATDSFLDGMAFSRGRFTVEGPGLPMLVIPSWPEAARVVEDCRF